MPRAGSEHDAEGRLITAEFPDFFLVTTYVPNSGRKLVTLDKRLDWDPLFRCQLTAGRNLGQAGVFTLDALNSTATDNKQTQCSLGCSINSLVIN